MFFKLIKNEQGASLVGAMVVMVALAATAAGVVSLSGTDTRSYTNNMQKSQAFAVSNAGLQYGLDRLNNGIDCDATKTISSGQSFTTTCDPNSSTITSVGTVGESKSTQTINADFAKNCVDLIVSGAEINGANVENIQLVKTCNKQAIVSKAYFSWNVSECALGTQCDGSNAVDDVDDDSVGDENNEVVYEDVGSPPNNKFWICHVPPGNPENRHSIAVNINGWIHGHSMGQNTHNMDYLGPCIISGTPDDDEEEVEDEGCAEDQIEIDGECYDQVVTCAETQESYEILEECVESDGGLQVIGVELAETAIYASGSVPFNYSPAVSTGNEVDVADSVMSNNGVYQMNLTYDSDLANYLGMWLSVTVEFADGSQLTGVVKLGNEPNPDAANEVAQAQAQEEAVGEEADEEVDASPNDSFEVENGVVIIDSNQNVALEVIGSAITCGAGGPEVYTRAELCIDDACQQLWGYNDLDGGETHSTTNSQQNSQYTIRANAYKSSCGNFNAIYDSENTLQVRTLRNGEQAPPLQGFGGQQSVTDFLGPYLNDNGTVMLDDNQVIMLFEMGVDLSADPDNEAADFQDLVILMTISDSQ